VGNNDVDTKTPAQLAGCASCLVVQGETAYRPARAKVAKRWKMASWVRIQDVRKSGRGDGREEARGEERAS